MATERLSERTRFKARNAVTIKAMFVHHRDTEYTEEGEAGGKEQFL